MNQTQENSKPFIGYEYTDVVTTKKLEALYVDTYRNFGWELESAKDLFKNPSNISLKFKRDRRIANKAELSGLQRRFDSRVEEINAYERSKTTGASITAYVIGILGCAFLAGAMFAYLAGMVALMTILAVPGFICWILAYALFKSIQKRKTDKVTPLIEGKYDEIYDISSKANALLA